MDVNIAVEGCCHGSLDAIYRLVSKNAELLIICGDFQAIRNKADLQTIKVPPKYLQAGDFPKYYLGKKKAPVLTIFIGGNHESLLYMRELQFGGWVAPNIYYLGEFGSVWYRGLRISGISGIYNYGSFSRAISGTGPAYTLPFSRDALRSAYHVKPKGFLKFMLSGLSDIVLTHDWPLEVWQSGDSAQLLRHKPFLKKDMASGALGSPLAAHAFKHLRPRYWFSLHLHTRFTAVVKHQEREYKKVRTTPEASKNTNEIHFSMDEDRFDESEVSEDKVASVGELDSSSATNHEHGDSVSNQANHAVGEKRNVDSLLVTHQEPTHTNFLALDKCLPGKRFIEHMTIKNRAGNPSERNTSLFYDARALAIHKVVEDFAALLQFSSLNIKDFREPQRLESLLQELSKDVDRIEKDYCNLEIPTNFKKIAPDIHEQSCALQYWPNNQTQEICQKIGIPEPNLLDK